ncbi:MAG: di-heme enzyme, partial [Myxococcota bacterium]
ISARSAFDRYNEGDESALSAEALQGRDLFFSERLECFHCHGGANFSDSFDSAHNAFDAAQFHNNGLYNVDGRGAYPEPNTGVHSITGDQNDMGAFRAPTLRNIALTAPYMHDGSLGSLEAVLDHYAAGGRLLTEGLHVGDGRDNPFKSPFVRGFELTETEKEALIAFLESLTDEALLTDPRFENPYAP